MTSDTSTRGRPRSSDRTEAILEATKELLMEIGYDGLRMQDVAERAGAGLATIYRRWATKQELVADVFATKAPLEVEPSGDPSVDLRATVSSIVSEMCGPGDSIVGVLAAARTHPEIGAALRGNVVVRTRDALAALMVPLLGEGHPSIDFLVDSIPGSIILRAGVMDETIDAEAFADQFMAIVEALAAKGV